MQRTPSLIAALALLLYGSSAFPQAPTPPSAPQASPPPTGQPAQNAAGTTDEALTKAIYSALNADPNFFFRHVNVRVTQGVATLSGFVNSSQAINRARTIASNVPGVTGVRNSLTLEPNRPR